MNIQEIQELEIGSKLKLNIALSDKDYQIFTVRKFKDFSSVIIVNDLHNVSDTDIDEYGFTTIDQLLSDQFELVENESKL